MWPQCCFISSRGAYFQVVRGWRSITGESAFSEAVIEPIYQWSCLEIVRVPIYPETYLVETGLGSILTLSLWPIVIFRVVIDPNSDIFPEKHCLTLLLVWTVTFR